MRMLIGIIALLCSIHNGIYVALAAQGVLMVPPPRSYTTLTARTSLVNDHPCGNNAFSTQYPSTSAIYSDFVHQRVLSKDSQIIKEGSLLNVTWLPIFFSSNTSTYQFSLCMDTSKYTYSKCIILSEYLTKNSTFDLFLSSYDTNKYNSGYNYHWNSVTDRFSSLDHHLKHHSLIVPDHIFHSLGIITSSGQGRNISATLIWQWVVSDYETIDNCADIIILPQSDDSQDHSNTVIFDDLVTPTIKPLPGNDDDSGTNEVCMTNPNATKYKNLDYANVGDRCGPEIATCAPGQCCNKNGVCGPYASNIYEYYYQDTLLESIPVYTALANFGFLDALSASMSFCETDVIIDNRYLPNSNRLKQDGYNPNDFIDLCWKCGLDNPNECSYENWFPTNGTTAIANIYKFYDSANDESNNNNNNGNNGNSSNGGNSSSSSGVIDLIVVILFLTIFCCIFIWLFRTYKSNNTKMRTTKRRLLDIQVEDVLNDDNGVSSVIDATGNGAGAASLNSNEDVTFGQHGYSDDSDADSHSKDPLDVEDSDQDKVGGILGRASLDATSSTDKPLPAGWEEYRTDAGERYYHNPESNVTQWDRPE